MDFYSYICINYLIMIKFRRIGAEDIAMLLAILIGGIYAITNPEHIDDAMSNTIMAVILIRLFW